MYAGREGRKDWQKFVGEAQNARRKFVQDGDLGSFMRRVFPKDGKPVAFAPVLLAEGHGARVPRTPEERMQAADDGKAASVSTNRWLASPAMPSFFHRWEDDLGHPRADIRLPDAAEGDALKLASAFSGTPVATAAELESPDRERWGQGVDWGDLFGPITPEERKVLLSMQPNKAPGLSGMKMAALQYMPAWMQDHGELPTNPPENLSQGSRSPGTKR